MKWKTKVPEPEPQVGDTKTKVIFAFLPRKCEDGMTRWLEDVEVTYKLGISWEGPIEASYSVHVWRKDSYRAPKPEPAGFDGD